MQGHDTTSNRAACGRAARRWVAGWLGAVLIAWAGCEEHRISLSEFMAMQEPVEVDVEGAVATQPATTMPSTLSEEEEALLDRELGPYRVTYGDQLGVTVLSPDISLAPAPGEVTAAGGRLFRVDRNGEIRIPQVGTVKVVGMELEDVEAAILDALVKRQVFTDPDQISVSVVLAAPYTTNVLVQGAALTPGVVRLRQNERNLMYAIAAAGGMTQIASGEAILRRLRRPGEEVRLNLFDPEALKTALLMPPLEDGDIVEVVAAQPNTIFVGGLVTVQGPQTYPPGTRVSVLQAVAAASGVRPDLWPHEATLIRCVNGRDVHVKLNLNRIQKAKDPNFMLAAGDVLWVPHTVETRIREWINNNMFFRMGATVNANYSLDYSMPGVDYLNRAARDAAFGGVNRTLQDQFDPFGFLLQNRSLQNLQGR
ncbi:MAG: hypothetical protein GXW89_18725 [Phycisphaerae bacterium]|nr:hypothetical protein [Phycisphaerae bacterium]